MDLITAENARLGRHFGKIFPSIPCEIMGFSPPAPGFESAPVGKFLQDNSGRGAKLRVRKSGCPLRGVPATDHPHPTAIAPSWMVFRSAFAIFIGPIRLFKQLMYPAHLLRFWQALHSPRRRKYIACQNRPH
jgi:hypothetical protein